MPFPQSRAVAPGCQATATAGSGPAEDWAEQLKGEVARLVEAPVRFERHEDRSVPASKVIGYDARGERCYYRHQYVMREERFDEDDLPMRVETWHEEVTAWRMRDSRWLRLAVRIQGFGGCGRRIDRVLSIVAHAADVGR
jgi:hypothetical protein